MAIDTAVKTHNPKVNRLKTSLPLEATARKIQKPVKVIFAKETLSKKMNNTAVDNKRNPEIASIVLYIEFIFLHDLVIHGCIFYYPVNQLLNFIHRWV